MATIRSFTSLEQSRKLAEILPIESADCFWDYDEMQKFHRISWFEDGFNKESQLMLNENNVCAWSLAALLEVLKQHCERLETTLRLNKNYNVFASGDGFTYRSFDEYPDGISNLIDVYYKIVIRLNELNLL